MGSRPSIKGLYPIQTAKVRSDISEKLTILMERKRWDKPRLAHALGISTHSMKGWLDGEYNFAIDTLIALGIVLGEPIIKVCVEELEENY